MLRRKTSLSTSLVAVIVLVCIGHYANWIRERRAVLNAPEKYHVFQGTGTATLTTGEEIEISLTTDAPWPLCWMGEEGQSVLGMNANKPAAEIARIRKLFPEAEIELVPEEDIDTASLAQAANDRH